MSTETMPSPALYFDTIFAFQRSAALKSAIELDVFTVIGDGAQMVPEIARLCGVPARGIRILCDYLATVGLVTKTGETYQLTADSAVFLTKHSPAYLGGTAAFLHSAELTGYFERLTETIRHGAQVSIVADDNPAWVEFARAMPPMMMPSAQAIADILGASAGPIRVLDLAAGHGIFGLVIAQHNPKAEIVAVDWAPVLEVATENAKAMGVGDRHRTLAGDAFKVDYGGGFDVALVTNFVHHFDRQTSVAFLKKVAGALKPGGRVVVLEFVPNEDRVTPPMAAQFSLVMLATTPGGDAYTFRELREMLTEAGFRDVTEHPLQGPQTVIVATK
jgi:2-polyprenyl-3-methyl-5-hydroxy-6-metoxy-1,4-benzoquinol methylase